MDRFVHVPCDRMPTAPPQAQRQSPTDREITAKTDTDLLVRLAELSEQTNKMSAPVEPPAEGLVQDAFEPADDLGFDRAPLSPMAARREADRTEPYVAEKGVHADPSAWPASDAGEDLAPGTPDRRAAYPIASDARVDPLADGVGLDDLTPSDPVVAQPASTARLPVIRRSRRAARIEADADQLDVDTLATHPSPFWGCVALVGMFALGSLLVTLYHLLFRIAAR